MARRTRGRSRKRIALQEISLTPLIDTALTLLIIFMVTAPMMQNAIKVTLPQGHAQEAAELSQELVVYINKEATLFFDGTATTIIKLVEELRQKIGTQKNRVVFVKADQGLSYGKVIEVVDHIKGIKEIEHVALAMEKPA